MGMGPQGFLGFGPTARAFFGTDDVTERRLRADECMVHLRCDGILSHVGTVCGWIVCHSSLLPSRTWGLKSPFSPFF